MILQGMLVRRGYRLVKAPVRSGGIALVWADIAAQHLLDVFCATH